MKNPTQTVIFPEYSEKANSSKSNKTASPILIYIDGASRGNPGPSGAGVWFSCNNKNLLHTNGFLGIKTNNQAEYLALALALFHLKKYANESERVIIRSDSLLLVKQMRGEYAIKNSFIKALAPLITILKMGSTCIFQHVPREKNSVADAEANKGIDNRTALPVEFKKLIAQY